MDYYSAIKKEWNLPSVTLWMGSEGIMLKWNKLDRNTQKPYDTLCVEFKGKKTPNSQIQVGGCQHRGVVGKKKKNPVCLIYFTSSTPSEGENNEKCTYTRVSMYLQIISVGKLWESTTIWMLFRGRSIIKDHGLIFLMLDEVASVSRQSINESSLMHTSGKG